MKKLSLIIMSLILVVAVACAAGCGDVTSIESIQFVEKPSTTFYLNDKLEFSIQVVNSDESIDTITYKDNKATLNSEDITEDVLISNFSTSTAGQKTAKVTYDEFSLTFDYIVIDPEAKYTAGTGSESDPYLVTTAIHFQNLLNEKSFNYFRLTNDIDCEGVTLTQANMGGEDLKGTYPTDWNSHVWSGVIDGAGYSILNIGKVNRVDADGNSYEANKMNELFGAIGSSVQGKAEFKDLTVNFACTEDMSGSPVAFCEQTGTDAVVSFTNVKLTGVINYGNDSSSWAAPFILKIGRDGYNSKATLTNCESAVTMMNTYAKGQVSPFVNVCGDNIKSLSLVNCKFSGTIEGSKRNIAAFVFDNGNNSSKISFTNCTTSNDAKIICNADGTSASPYVKGGSLAVMEGGTIASGVVDTTSITPIAVTQNGTTLTITPNCAVDKYVVFINGKLKYCGSTGFSGNSFFTMTKVLSTASADACDIELLTIKADTSTNAIIDDAKTYGSKLIGVKSGDDFLTYNCKDICDGIDYSSASVTVIAMVKDGESYRAVGCNVNSITVNVQAN